MSTPTMAEPGDTELEEPPHWGKMRPYKNVVLYDTSTELDEIQAFNTRDDDVWVCSYPRSGNTLMMELVYLIQTLDFDKAKKVRMLDRTPWIDVFTPKVPGYRGVKYVDAMESPRVIKSHFHHFMLPDQLKNGKGKIVYMSRNPNAAALSYYKLHKYFMNCPIETLREWLELFLQDGVWCCPWWLHVLQYWEHRNDANVLLLRFEDVVQNKKAHIRKVADFLGKYLTDEQVDQIDDHTEIKAMKAAAGTNLDGHDKQYKTDKAYGGYINQGSLDAWKDEVPEDIQVRINQMVKDRLGHTDWQLIPQQD